MKKFQKWLIKNWWIAIPLLPFVIMILLHIAIALGDYFNININVPNIEASDWFMFSSSYLGGSIALIGVILTIKHSTNTHNHQMAIHRIEKEADEMAQSISCLNVSEPVNIAQLFLSVANNGVLSISDLAILRDRINAQRYQINSSRVRMFMSTNATAINPSCNICTTPCALKTVIPEIAKEYDSLTITLLEALSAVEIYMDKHNLDQKLSAEIKQCIQENTESNIMVHSTEKIDDLVNQRKGIEKESEELIILCKKCSNMYSKEVQALIQLSKTYIGQRKENARKQCFEDWKGGQQ